MPLSLTTPPLLVARPGLSASGDVRAARYVAPLRDLVLAAGRILVERDVVARDQVVATRLDEPGHVLGEMLARLGDEVAEAAEDLEAHPLPGRLAPLGGQLAQGGIEILAVALEAQVEGDVVDAGAEVVDLVEGHAQPAGEVARPCLCTLWQRPTVRIDVARFIAMQSIAIGLV